MQEQEIDLIEVVYKLWNRRKLIILFTVIFTLAGGVIAYILPRQYVAECILGIESQDNSMRVKVEGMAGVQNMNVGDIKEIRALSPVVYPNILFSVPFQKELIHTKFALKGKNDSISFFEYYTGKSLSDSGFVKQDGVQNVSFDEAACMAYLKDHITMKVVDRDGYLKLSVSMRNPEVAALLAHKTQEMLQKYITEFKIAKAQVALNFIEGRYVEIKNELEEKQRELIKYREKNKNVPLILKETEEKILLNDYDLFFNLYADILRQREQARIQVKENMPVLTVIEPVVLPDHPVKPKRFLIIFVSMLFGFFIGSGWVLLSSSYSNWKSSNKPVK